MLAIFGLSASVAVAAATSAQAAPPPNIIVIQTDDQDASSLTREVMPETMELLHRHATIFTDYIDSGPLCCPSRAVMLTGQYGHNNGVLWNDQAAYGDLRAKGNTLPVWLQRAGYRTVHLGKYLNGYPRAVGDPDEIPPGWDDWRSVLEPVDYYDYTLRVNGEAVPYGSAPGDYLTDVLNDEAVRLIHEDAPRRRPLFMALDQHAPHDSAHDWDPRCEFTAAPAPQDLGLFTQTPIPTPPSFNEKNVSDKPAYVRARAKLSTAGIKGLQRRYRCRLASLRAVDRGVAEIIRALRSEHELDDTAIVFTSDNGWIQGPHRIPGRKIDPYEEVLHVPFVLRLPSELRPPGGAPRKLSTTVANIDVAPTLLRIAGARPCSARGRCRTLDGRSMLPAIRSHGRNWPKHRGILLELRSAAQRAASFTPCDYEGIRTAHEVYVEYHSSTRREKGPCVPLEEVEHYNLRSDPFELQNRFPAPPGTRAARQEAKLAARLKVLSDCAGIKGRDPKPPSGHFCD